MKRIVFMGSAPFSFLVLQSLCSLDAFKDAEAKIIAIYIKSIKEDANTRAIKKYANKHDIEIKNVLSFKSEQSILELQNLAPDLIIVASYGLILRANVLNIPLYGCINLHPSALPRWRGASPLQRSIMAGDKNTSVCIMQMGVGLDDGDIILRRDDIHITDTTTFDELSEITAHIGADLLMQSVILLQNNKQQLQEAWQASWRPEHKWLVCVFL